MLHTLARDPGLKPGYVGLSATGALLAASHKEEDWVICPNDTGWELAATEGQWWWPGSDVDPNDLFTLAFDAGWELRGIPAARHLRVPVKLWRGGTNVRKDQLQRKLAKSLTPEERKLFAKVPESRHGDVLDAILIGRCAQRVAPTTTEYDWPRSKRPRRSK